jgi:hypothetical protein
MGSDMMLPRKAYYKPFTVRFPDKCEWQNSFNPDDKQGLVWYTDRSHLLTPTLVLGCADGV